MDLIRLKAQLTISEDRRNKAYPDPLTNGAPWTIGIGHTGPEVRRGLVWTDAQIDKAYDQDVQEAIAGLDNIAPWWRGLDTVRQNVLLDMCFNMGEARLKKFKRMLRACAAGEYEWAAAEMANSLWAEQVGDRADHLCQMMKKGEW
jgi:lysozyme